MKTITKTLYEFDDLSEDAKDKAREWFRDGGFDYEWHDTVFEDAKTIGKLLGIQIKDIYFSGFSSQGDGACFEGSYSYEKQSVAKVTNYAPKDTELQRIARELRDAQRVNFYRVSGNVKQSGHYNHKYCTEIHLYNENSEFVGNTEDTIIELLRDFMDWIYKQLQTEYEYLNSDEQVDETIRINEYTFDVNGKRES